MKDLIQRNFLNLEGVILQDIFQLEGCWMVSFLTRLDFELEGVKTLKWYVKIPDSYPLCDVSVFPSKLGGLKKTYPHMQLNRKVPESHWTTGKICLTSNFKVSAISDNELSENRLRIKLSWLIQWIEKAANGTLYSIGDVVELPELFPVVKTNFLFDSTIGIDLCSSGRVGVASIGRGTRYLCLKAFSILENIDDVEKIDSSSSDLVYRESSGGVFSKGDTSSCVFVELGGMPFVNGEYRYPVNFEELLNLVENTDLFIETLSTFIARSKQAEQYLIIRYPVQVNHGEGEKRYYHNLVKLTYSSNKLHLRYSGNYSRSLKKMTRTINLDLNEEAGKKLSIKWGNSISVSLDDLFSRSKNYDVLRDKSVLVIGLGSLGSAFTEILIRNGVREIGLVDFDNMEPGNVVRHSLSFFDSFNSKVYACADRFHHINPWVDIDTFDDNFRNMKDEDLVKYDCIIDVSTSMEVISKLLRTENKNPNSKVLSFGFGYNAKPVYCFQSSHRNLSIEGFCSHGIKIEEKPELFKGNSSLGCWAPSFPAGTDEVLSAAVKCYEFFIDSLSRSRDNYWKIYDLEALE